MSKFKVGDKVKILPSAVDGGVSKKDIGQIGEVKKYCKDGDYFLVEMDRWKGRKGELRWGVHPHQIEPVVRVGQQLMFAFMQTSDYLR